MEPGEQARLTRALEFALAAHAGQTRKGRDVPYVGHLFRVAGMILEHGGGVDLAIAGLLHDAVEDCDGVETEQIAAGFGADVARVVAACTDTAPGDVAKKKSPWIERKRRYIAQVSAADVDVHLVVACDKLDNLQSLITDLSHEGPETLERFSASPRQTRWYYESVRSLISDEVPREILSAIDAALATLREYIDEASPER
jgi:(p)ppGpp synthase/HD superfamily hydrolase